MFSNTTISARSQKSQKSQKSIQDAVTMTVEQLEERQMMSAATHAAAFGRGIPAAAPAKQLVVQLNRGNDNVVVTQNKRGITITDNGKSKTYAGTFSSLVIHCNGGSDQVIVAPSVSTPTAIFADSSNGTLIAGAKNDALIAGSGNVSLVAISGANTTLVEGSGHASVWMNDDDTLKGTNDNTTVHNVDGFINSDSMALDGGADLEEPATDTEADVATGWANAASLPLFSKSGPVRDDIHQQNEGTCYFLSALAATASVDPQHIVDMIVPLGDGTYAVDFQYNSQDYFVRIDSMLPVDNSRHLVYANLGAGNSTWAPLIEKAWSYMYAAEQGANPSYGLIEGNFGKVAYEALGASDIYTTQNNSDFTDGQDMGEWIDNALQQGMAVSIGFKMDVPGVVYGGHEYTVCKVVRDAYGNVAGMWLRNPWGVDLRTQDGSTMDGRNDGYVFISADYAHYAMGDLAAAVI